MESKLKRQLVKAITTSNLFNNSVNPPVLSGTATFRDQNGYTLSLTTFLIPLNFLFQYLQVHLRKFSAMDEQTQTTIVENGDSHQTSSDSEEVLDIYPLGCYYFASVQTVAALRNETVADRLLRMKANYDAFGMRNSVAAVMLVELFKHPHLLLLQVRNTIFKLPGGRLRPGESDVECLKRKLSSKLSAGENGRGPEWEVGRCLGMWWKPDFEALVYPYLPPKITSPKECTKLFLVNLPASRRFVVPRNFKLLAVPLCQVHDNDKLYGTIISSVPRLLSRFSFNIVEP